MNFSIIIHGAVGQTVSVRVESGAWKSNMLNSSELCNSTLWGISTRSTFNNEDFSMLSCNALELIDLTLRHEIVFLS